MASTSSPPRSPGSPSAPSDSSSSSTSAPPPRSFLFLRHRRLRRPSTPPPSPSKKPRLMASPKPRRLIGPLSFSDFFQEEFTPVMHDLFITLGVLHYFYKQGSSIQTYEILRSLEYITHQCADEVPNFSIRDSQYTLSLAVAVIEPAPPDRQDLHPELDDVWECTIGPCTQLEDVLKNGQVKLSEAVLKITEILSKSRDVLLLRTYPQMARQLEQAAHSFEAMYRVVHRKIELDIEEAQKAIADALLDLAFGI